MLFLQLGRMLNVQQVAAGCNRAECCDSTGVSSRQPGSSPRH